MSLTSYRTAPPRGKAGIHCPDAGGHPAIRFDRGNGQERRESGTGTADAGLLRLSGFLFRFSFPAFFSCFPVLADLAATYSPTP